MKCMQCRRTWILVLMCFHHIFLSIVATGDEREDTSKSDKRASKVMSFGADGKLSVAPDTDPLNTGTAPAVTSAIVEELSRSSADCGANALYVLLKMSGIQCSREEIHGKLKTTGEGASLLDLKVVAAEYGLETVVVELPMTSFAAHIPLIARVASPSSRDGHFVVVVQLTDDAIVSVDGTSARTMPSKLSTFERLYSGHALIPVRVGTESQFMRMVVLVNVIGVLAIGGVILIRRLWRSKQGNSPA